MFRSTQSEGCCTVKCGCGRYTLTFHRRRIKGDLNIRCLMCGARTRFSAVLAAGQELPGEATLSGDATCRGRGAQARSQKPLPHGAWHMSSVRVSW